MINHNDADLIADGDILSDKEPGKFKKPIELMADSTVGERIPIGELEPVFRKAVHSGVEGWHPKFGKCLAIDEAVIVLPVHTKRQSSLIRDKETTDAPPLIIQAQTEYMGTGIVLATRLTENDPIPTAFCTVPSPFFEALGSPIITILYHERKKVIGAFRYDLSREQRLAQTLQELRDLLQKHSAGERTPGYFPLVANIPEAFFAYSIGSYASSINHNLSPTERLSFSWAESLNQLFEDVNILAPENPWEESIKNALKHYTAEMPRTVVLILDALLESYASGGIGNYSRIKEVITLDSVPEIARFISRVTLSKDKKTPLVKTSYAVDDALRLFLWNPEQTRCGLQLPWLTAEGKLEYLDLEPDTMQNPSIYWNVILSLTGLGPLFELGRMVRANDTPMDVRNTKWITGDFPAENYPRVENIEEARLDTKRFLEEAATAKQWTIPPGAIVQGPFGLFSTIELLETPNAIYGTLRDHDGAFHPFFVSPERGEIEIRCFPTNSLPGSEDPPVKGFSSFSEFYKNTNAALALLIAAIVRDFWVVEHRERVFRTKAVKAQRKPSKRRDELRVVYLPRVRYSGVQVPTPSEPSTGESLRTAHKVRPHLRRAESASLAQSALARRYGFVLPSRYTFVRPHWRGHRRRQVVYRSRSALNALYIKIQTGGRHRARPLWFQFELDVRDVLESLGFETEHTAAARTGDDGVDVFASRKRRGDVEHWLVQCKCWADGNRVGKGVVRELIGSIASQEGDVSTRGMIVTTSSLTLGARKLAKKHSIEWIEGEKFQSLISKSNDSKRNSTQ